MIDQYTTSDFVWEPYPVWRAISIFIADNWFPVLAGAKEDERLAGDFLRAGYQCSVVREGEILDYVNEVEELQTKFFAQGGHYVDEFGNQTLCCRNPPGVPVQPRGGYPPVETRRPSGIPAQSPTGQRLGP